VSAAFPRKYTRTYEFYAEIPPLLLPRLRRTRARGSRLFAIKIRESLSNNVCRRCLTAYRSSSRSRSRASRVLAGVGSIKGTLIVAAGEQWRHRNYSSDAAGAASRVRACTRTSGMPSGAKARARAREVRFPRKRNVSSCAASSGKMPGSFSSGLSLPVDHYARARVKGPPLIEFFPGPRERARVFPSLGENRPSKGRRV